jgi:hypothetical protein
MTTNQDPATTAATNGTGAFRPAAPLRLRTPDSVTPRLRRTDEDGNPYGPTSIQLNVGVHVHGGGMDFAVTDQDTSLDIQDVATPLCLTFDDQALINLAVLATQAARAMLHARGRAPDEVDHQIE